MEEYVHSNDNHVIAGGLLGVGIANCSVKHDSDAVSYLFLMELKHGKWSMMYLLRHVFFPFVRYLLFFVSMLIIRTHPSESGQLWALGLRLLVHRTYRYIVLAN